jgi:hypothetical protein
MLIHFVIFVDRFVISNNERGHQTTITVMLDLFYLSDFRGEYFHMMFGHITRIRVGHIVRVA